MRMMPETEAIWDASDGRVSDIGRGIKLSCTVVIGETVLFFGGWMQLQQISQLTPLGLIRIGTLPFSLEFGTCLVMDSQVFLGFTRSQNRRCWSRLVVLNNSQFVRVVKF